MQTRSEAQAIELFNQLGREAAVARYKFICKLAQERYEDSLVKYGSMPAGFTALNYLNSAELQERYILGLGIQLCIDEQQEARERVLARCLARKGPHNRG